LSSQDREGGTLLQNHDDWKNMSTREVTIVGGFGHSNGEPDIIENVGKHGSRFSGTFTGRTALAGIDFMTSVYIDKESRLYLIFQAGERNVEVIRENESSYKLQLNSANPMGSISYDSKSGTLSIVAAKAGHWFQGTLVGMHVTE